jgi:hypothetical protein
VGFLHGLNLEAYLCCIDECFCNLAWITIYNDDNSRMCLLPSLKKRYILIAIVTFFRMKFTYIRCSCIL